MPAMTQKELVEFLERPLVVSFTTINSDGSPQVTPLWYEYDQGKFYCWASSTSVKVRNIKNNRHVALCIATHDKPYKYVLAGGTSEVTRQGVEERAYSIRTRYYGQERGKKFTEETLTTGNSVLLVVSPEKLLTESAA